MKIFYITLNNQDEAKAISYELLKKKYAVCTNWFPISCCYNWEGEIKEGAEIVLIVKTGDSFRDKIEEVVKSKIDYTNFMAELDVASVNDKFLDWLNMEMALIAK